MATQFTRTGEGILRALTRLQKKCGDTTGHDPNNDNMHSIGRGWYRYGSAYTPKYQRYANTVCQCRYCGYTTIAHRLDNDRTNETGKWEVGQGGLSDH